MEAKNILSANILDILFEGKNKEYGAYDLRNTYDRRINTALGITAIAIIIICSSAFIGNNTDDKVVTRPDIITELANPDIEKEKIICLLPKALREIARQSAATAGWKTEVMAQGHVRVAASTGIRRSRWRC